MTNDGAGEHFQLDLGLLQGLSDFFLGVLTEWLISLQSPAFDVERRGDSSCWTLRIEGPTP